MEAVRVHAHLVAAVAADVDRAVAAVACAAAGAVVAAVAAPAAAAAAAVAAAAPGAGSDARCMAVAATDRRAGHPGQSARDVRLAAVAVPRAAAVAAPVSARAKTARRILQMEAMICSFVSLSSNSAKSDGTRAKFRIIFLQSLTRSTGNAS